MRGIGRGQHITVLIIPEVQELMNRQLRKLPALTAEAVPMLMPVSDGGGAVGQMGMVATQAQRLRDISGTPVCTRARACVRACVRAYIMYYCLWCCCVFARGRACIIDYFTWYS